MRTKTYCAYMFLQPHWSKTAVRVEDEDSSLLGPFASASWGDQDLVLTSVGLFHTLSLEAMVPADHLLRGLEAEGALSFVRHFCASYYSDTGQRSIDPVVLFKMMLLRYLYGTTSERHLAEEGSLDLAFRWHLGYDLDEPTPNCSVLSKA